LFTPPMAFFTYTVSGLMVNVNASASIGIGIVSCVWDWGDGTTGTGMTAAHLYAVAGTYKTTLTVTDNKGLSGSASNWITAPPPPPGPP
jgi:PKD repeat protein